MNDTKKKKKKKKKRQKRIGPFLLVTVFIVGAQELEATVLVELFGILLDVRGDATPVQVLRRLVVLDVARTR